MTPDASPPSLADRLRAASLAMGALGGAVEAGRPWPLHVVDHDAGPESAWGPTEVLAHVAEMLLYWRGEIARILDTTPEPVPFGRQATDRLRVLTIERDRTLPPRELLERIADAAERYDHLLRRLGPVELGRRGLHPVRGEVTVADILERFVVGHAEEHVGQLRAALNEPSPGSSRAG